MPEVTPVKRIIKLLSRQVSLYQSFRRPSLFFRIFANMTRFAFIIFFLLQTMSALAAADTVVVPIGRQFIHDRIRDEQKLLDRADGKADGQLKVSANPEVNAMVTDYMFRKLTALKDSIELNKKIPGHKEKVTYLSCMANLLKAYRTEWKAKQLNPGFAPVLVNSFEKAMNASIDSISMAPMISELSYETGKILVDIFKDNPGIAESRKIVYLKFCSLYPEKILQGIEPFANEPFADSLVSLCAKRNPTAVYSASQSSVLVTGKLIRRNTDPVVTTILTISKTPNSLLYFPFLDDILQGRKTIEGIKKFVGDGEKGYDSVGYYKLLVQTEISYYKRMATLKDTPIAMFGANGLREMLQTKALQHFIKPINDLHEKPEAVRMRAVEPLNSIDLYYMIVTGESEIYTSSYKHSFTRLLQRLGKIPRTDSLLLTVNFDYFKKFIKMAASFNKLDEFLKLMPAARSQMLMKAFVANLDNSGSLEDAVDVADSYSSISDKKLLQTIFNYVKENEAASIANNNTRGTVIYGLLKTIFLSADSSAKINIPKELGIRSIYDIDYKTLADDSGRIVQQVFFYGDDDGKLHFRGFINSFSSADWDVNMKPEWAEIRSKKGKRIWIFANRPLDSDSNLDDSAQVHLNKYLSKNDITPNIIVHRGHSYWLPRTLKRMPYDAQIVILGSCGGYKNLNEIIAYSPDANIISTKEIGRGDINQPVLNYINQTLREGKTIVWKNMWATLSKQFASADKDTRDSWDDYIPPYRNLGAIFIKAYNKKTESQ